ncbi:MAG: hypothetical protein PHV63_03465 [Candidatus Daviesbacteria bacterium]|nr:hypothetical protein [Candidatus Daviesbacteria bacterium]
MSELPSGRSGNGPESLDKPESSDNPVREASAGFIKRTWEKLNSAFGSLHTGARFVLIIGAIGEAGYIINSLSNGKAMEGVIGGIIAGVGMAGAAAWMEIGDRRLDAQSARLKEKLARGAEKEAPQDRNEPEA